jgi:hypothetical protein
MNTKSILLLGALGAVGLTTAVAQTNVYSQNAVGYVNKTIPPGYSLIAAPLNGTNNLIATVLAGVPSGTQTYFYNPSTGFDIYEYDGTQWQDVVTLSAANPNVPVGVGFYIKNVGVASFNLTFVGDVPQGSLTNTVPGGYSIRSSMVPQSGGITTVLGYPAAAGNQVLKYNNPGNTFTVAEYDGSGWQDVVTLGSVPEPTLVPGEAAFILNNGATKPWIRSFSVNN